MFMHFFLETNDIEKHKKFMKISIDCFVGGDGRVCINYKI